MFSPIILNVVRSDISNGLIFLNFMWQINWIPVFFFIYFILLWFLFNLFALEGSSLLAMARRKIKTSGTGVVVEIYFLSQLFFVEKENFSNDWTLVITDLYSNYVHS